QSEIERTARTRHGQEWLTVQMYRPSLAEFPGYDSFPLSIQRTPDVPAPRNVHIIHHAEILGFCAHGLFVTSLLSLDPGLQMSLANASSASVSFALHSAVVLHVPTTSCSRS